MSDRERMRGLICAGGVLVALGALHGCEGKRDGDGTQKVIESPPSAAQAPSPVKFAPCWTGMPEYGNWKCDPIFADFNHDGHIDLAGTPRLSESVQVWFGDGKCRWTNASNGLKMPNPPCGGGLAAADVNNDGNLDLVVADHCRGVFVFLGDGQGNWEPVVKEMYPQEVLPPKAALDQYMGAESITAGDVNGDGFVDLVAGASDVGGGLQLYLGDGTGRNWTRKNCNLPAEGWALRCRLIDLNGDGKLDLVATHQTGPRVWIGDGGNTFLPASTGLPTPLTGGIYNGLDVADFNKDGKPDLVFGNWVDGPEVYLQRAGVTWEKQPDVFPAMLGGAWGVAAGDVDGDGILDLVVAGRLSHEDVGYVYGVFYLRGNAKGSWDHVADTELPTTGLMYTWGVAIRDIDEDGAPDIAAASGGIIATDIRRMKPAIPQHMLLWTTLRNPPRR